MTTSFTEMLELLNFGHMKTSAYNLNHMTKFCWRRGGRNHEVITFISKYRFLRRPGLAIFADIIKIITIVIKKIFKD